MKTFYNFLNVFVLVVFITFGAISQGNSVLPNAALADRAPIKSEISKEQLKILHETGFTNAQLLVLEQQGIDLKLLQDKEYLLKAEELLGMNNNGLVEKQGSLTDAVSVYTFDQADGTFEAITGGTVLGTATSDDQYFVDPATPVGGTTKTGPGFPIGFNFEYDGYVFDVFGINNNGWISLGQSSLTPSVDMNTTSGYTPLSSVVVTTPEYLRSRIALLGRDIQAQAGAELRIETTGTAPDRVLVVQFVGYKKYGTGGTGDNFNFQVKLYETTNVIEVVYGGMTSNTTSTTVQVGLGGSVSTDFYNRATTTDWASTTAGLTNTASCALSDLVYPSDGLTFIFNPPPAGSPGSPFNPAPQNGAQYVPITTNLTWDFGTLTETYDLYFDIVNPPLNKVVDNAVAGASGMYDPPVDLDYSIPYYWQVVARNSNNLETNGPVWTFSSECGSISTYPWTEGFENVAIPAYPACWLEENGDWVTTNNASSTFDADAYTGTQFLRESYSATNEFMWTPGFALDAGIPYDFSFWWAGDNYAGWTGDVFYNTSQSSVGATQIGTSFVEIGTTTTKVYEQVINTFQPTTAGTYYFAIRVNCTSTPWYLSFDDFRFEPSPSCPMPGTLSATNITPTAADLMWNSFSGLSDIEFGLAGFTPTGTPTHTGITSPYTMDGLTAQTTYSFYVRDDCGSGSYSSWAGPKTFTTACDIFSAPFLEEFTTWPPLCWDLTGGTYSWAHYTTGVQCAEASFWGQTSGNTDIMTTPLIDISGGNFGLEFYWSHLFSTTYPDDALEVLVSDDNGATWTQVWYKEGTELNSNDGAGNTAPGTFVSSEIISLSSFASPIKVQFYGHSGYGPDLFIDNVNIFNVAYGTLDGTVTDMANSTPIEGAVITIGSMSATTGSDGSYSIPGILIGDYTVTCTATGYNQATADVTILEDLTTTLDFELTYPEFVVDPLIIDEELEIGESTDVLVNISNPGLGSVNWNASLNILSDNVDDPGDILLELNVTVPAAESQMLGGEWDGTYFWTTGAGSATDPNKLYKFDADGTLLATYDQPAASTAWGVRDLAWDGTFLYGGNENQFYKIDPATGTFTLLFNQTWGTIRALTWVPTENAFYTKDFGNPLRKFDMTGTVLETIAVPEAAAAYGAAWDHLNNMLWIFDQSGPSTTHGTTFIEFDIATGAVTGNSFLVPLLTGSTEQIAGGAFFATDLISGKAVLGGVTQGTPDDMIFAMELGDAATWITIDLTAGTLPSMANEDMTVHLDATQILLPGVYEAEIHFTTMPDVGTEVVNVTLTVAGLIPAVNLTGSFDCTDVMLTWEMPTGGAPDSWNVYRDGTLMGSASAMEHTDEMVMTGIEYTYTVKAVYSGEESMATPPFMITVPIPANLVPTNLDAMPNEPTAGDVTLTWDSPDACVAPDGYNVFKDGVQINTALVTEMTYVDLDNSTGLYEYKVKAVYYFGESGFSAAAYALIVGMEELDAARFQIFPNPASDRVTVKSPVEISAIRVLNNSGQLVMDIQVNAADHQIDVSQLESGIYYIRLETDEGQVLQKFVVE